MESSTFEQVVEDEDVVLELEAISIADLREGLPPGSTHGCDC